MAIENREPFRVGFLLIDGFALMSYASALEPLRVANLKAGAELYRIDHIGLSPASSSAGVMVGQTMGFDDTPDLDMVLVVAGGDPMRYDNRRTFRWLRRVARRPIIVGGVSGGPVILAKSGIMNGRRMTVHWEHAAPLSEAVPSVIVERTLYVVEKDRMTCAGGTAPLDMMHAFLSDRHGAGFARAVSDWLLHTETRRSFDPQRAGLTERYGTTSEPVIEAIEAMESHISDPLTLEQLSAIARVGQRHLNRLFREKLGRPTMNFYRDLRLEAAQDLLRQSTLTVTEIALATGFAGSAHFSQSFKSLYGVSPSAARRRPVS
ncbi:GlxA family transcriptional regulator [Hoeflea sp. CAU 1731]